MYNQIWEVPTPPRAEDVIGIAELRRAFAPKCNRIGSEAQQATESSSLALAPGYLDLQLYRRWKVWNLKPETYGTNV